jgi:hypothetical protein
MIFLETSVIEEDGFDIEIFCPFLDLNGKQQLVKIQISKDFETIPDGLNERTEGIDKLSEKYFWITKDLIRLHTKQFLFDKPQINAMALKSVKIQNRKETLLERNVVTVYIREEDASEFKLDQNTWHKTSEYIKYGIEPETHLLILLDAKYNALLGNFREAIILTCVAVEEFAINELDCDIKTDPRYKGSKFIDFFYEMTKKTTKKDFKEKKHSYYHFLSILFEARNNIAHGRGCFLTPSHRNHRIIQKDLKTLHLQPGKKVSFNKKTCLTLIDKTFDLFEFISC